MMMRRRLPRRRLLGHVGLLVLTLLPVQSPAQQSAPSTSPFLDSVSADVARHLQVLAADSMWAHTTPSPELERAARYVAAQLEGLGLQAKVSAQGDVALSRSMPSSQPSGWIQHYPIPGRRPVDYTTSAVNLFVGGILDRRGSTIVSEAGHTVMRMSAVSLAAGARLASGGLGSASAFGDGGDTPVVVAGRHTVASLRNAAVRNRPVFYVPLPGESAAVRQGNIDYLATVSEGVIVLDDADSASFATALQTAQQQPKPFLEPYLKEIAEAPGWVVHMRRAIARPWLASLGLDVARVYAATDPLVQAAKGGAVGLTLRVDSATQDSVTAPNVVGLLEGTDTVLKNEYIVISASLAAHGTRSTPSGRAGLPALLAIARAFSQPGARPRRSLLFVATSGTAQGGWGSAFLASKLLEFQPRPRVVANLHLGTRGSADGGILTVDGVGDVQSTVPLPWLAAEHPELDLALEVGATVLRPELPPDVFIFVRRMIPTLVVHLPPEHGVDGDRAVPVALKPTPLARAAGLVFYISQVFATGAERPWWTTEARQRYLQLFPP